MKCLTAWVHGIVIVLLSACGSDGGRESLDSDDPFPLAVGNRWETRITQSVSAGPVIPRLGSREVVRSFLLEDVPTWEVKVGNDVPRYEWYQRSTTELVRVPTPHDSALDKAIGPRLMLYLPVKVGTQWVQVDTSVITGAHVGEDGRPLPTKIYTTAEVLAQESVTVPAGTFHDAYKVRYVERQETELGPAGDLAWSYEAATAWLVPGVGLVDLGKERLHNTSLRTDYSNEALVAYRLEPSSP